MKLEEDINAAPEGALRPRIGEGPPPHARKVYIEGSRPDIQVPTREIHLSMTPSEYGAEQNPPVRLYDTGGPYTDWEAAKPDVRLGLQPLRRPWILERGDVEGLRRGVAGDPRGRLRRQPPPAAPGGGRPHRHADALRPPRRDHAGDGVRRRPRGRRARARARRGRLGPGDHPGQRQPSRDRADGHRAQLPGEGQRQHRQLGGHVLDRRGGRQAHLGDPVGRRHRHGPLHRPRHPHHPRVDHPQHPGPHRHRADLPGPREGRRRGRPHLGGLPGHHDRAGRAGRRLHDRPRRRAAALRPADGQAGHRHRQPRRVDHGGLVPGPPPGELPVHALRRALRDLRRLRRRLLAGRRPAARGPSPTPTTRRSSPSCARWASSPRSPGATTSR